MGQVSCGGGAVVTVKVAWQVVINGAQLLVYVNVTVVEPPQKEGAPVLLFVKAPLQPPLAVAVANQVAKAVFTATCVWQAATVVLVGQVSTTGGGAVTVKVDWQDVVNGAQVLAKVKVTVSASPQFDGGKPLLSLPVRLHPPCPLNVASQAAYWALIAACVWQEATVVGTGQIMVTGGGAATVKLAWQVVVNGAQVLV